MRTKTLLLTAALSAAGIASSMAQVYSVNLVGYINKSLPQGFYLMANQLNNGSGNKVTELLPNPPDGTFVYKFNGSGYTSIAFFDGAWEGSDLNMTAAPGEGAYIKSPTAHTVTFVGEVVLTSDVTISNGYSIASSVIPQSAPLDQLGFPAVEGDFLYFYNNTSGGYNSAAFFDGAWEGTGYPGAPGAPVPDIAQSFFIKHSGAATHWTRTFTVN
jgi:hypothetical protein